ncbi:MAG: zinc ribbon domain-containing protein [Bacteroidaceae bacterium]|nr:zinc ribbon domain-containing protein [Bacteroidaceae bacterium]
MAFCSKCGQQIADGVTVCPFCGEPIEAAPAAAPRTPVYDNAPEQLDFIPSAASAAFPKFAYIGIAGAVLALIVSFFNVFETPRLYYFLYAVAAACSAVAMFKVYDGLKKGLAGHRKPMPGLITTTAWFQVAGQALMVLGGLIVILAGLDGVATAAGIIVFAGVINFVYLILMLIVAFTLIGSYTGNVKTFGWLLVIPVIFGIIAAIGGGAAALSGGKVGVITIIIAVISCAISVYIYLFAKKIISDGK